MEEITITEKRRGRPKKYTTDDEIQDINKTYYKTFITKNQIKDKSRKCELCGGSISNYFNKSHHNKTMKHKRKIEEQNKENKNTEN